jgi:predicted enzyme related to lactoylglutathione lyase
MADPLDALRSPSRPVQPDPDFATELRDNLRRLILNGETVPTRTETTTEAPVQAQLRSLTPYLAVSDARAAMDFYVEAFGAVRRGDPIVMPDGKIGHAELGIGDAVLMLAEEHPDARHFAPDAAKPPTIRVEVSNVDESVDRAVELGAELLRPVSTSPYGRGGSILDPFGHRWMVAQAPPRTEPQTPPIRHGHAGYFTFQVPDAERAKAFYGTVLGWQFSPGTTEGGWGIEGNGLHGGLWGGPGRQVGWKLMYAVDDLPSALERVRAQGGEAGEPEHHPYGLTAECVDDQGIEFWLWQQPAE